MCDLRLDGDPACSGRGREGWDSPALVVVVVVVVVNVDDDFRRWLEPQSLDKGVSRSRRSVFSHAPPDARASQEQKSVCRLTCEAGVTRGIFFWWEFAGDFAGDCVDFESTPGVALENFPPDSAGVGMRLALKIRVTKCDLRIYSTNPMSSRIAWEIHPRDNSLHLRPCLRMTSAQKRLARSRNFDC